MLKGFNINCYQKVLFVELEITININTLIFSFSIIQNVAT